MNNIFRFILSIVIVSFAGLIGSIFTNATHNAWYASLAKPSINPPSYIFGPIWIVLYIMVGISLYLFWKNLFKKRWVKTSIILFFIQLILNSAWSIIFFRINSVKGALIDIIALWFSIIFTIIFFYKISKISAWLLVPYLIWVSFATYLNYLLYILN